MSWSNPRWTSITDPDLRAVFQSLEDFTRHPTFENGIQLGNADGSSSIGTVNPTTDRVDYPPLPEVGNDNLAALLPDGSITTRLLADLAVNDTKLADLSVTLGKLAADSVDTSKIVDAAVSDVKVATAAITTTKIADNSITTPKLTASSVTANELAANSVIAGKIATNAVTTTTLAANAVTAAKIATDTITANEIAAGAITASELASGSVTTVKLVADAVTANELAAMALGVGKYIRSTSYVAGSSGWAIDAAGTAEFNNVTIRGTLATNTVAGWLTTGTGGGFRTAFPSNPRIEIENTNTLKVNFDVTGSDSAPGYITGFNDTTAGAGVVWVKSPSRSSGEGHSQLILKGLASDGSQAFLEATDIHLQAPGPAEGSVYVDGVIYGTTSADQPRLKTPPMHDINAPGESAFINSWANYLSGFQTARYYKDAEGTVHVEGVVTHPSNSNAVMFGLPAGFRPQQEQIFTGMGGGTDITLNIDTAGNIWVSTYGTAGNSTYVSLNSIIFSTA